MFTKEIQDAIWLRDKFSKTGKHQVYKTRETVNQWKEQL